MYYNLNMQELKWKDAQKEIQNGTALLVFFTSWCGDCKMMEPVVKNAEKEILQHNKNVKFIKVDAEEAELFREEQTDWQVLKVPSFFMIKNGVKKHIGYEYLPIEKIVNLFL